MVRKRYKNFWHPNFVTNILLSPLFFGGFALFNVSLGAFFKGQYSEAANNAARVFIADLNISFFKLCCCCCCLNSWKLMATCDVYLGTLLNYCKCKNKSFVKHCGTKGLRKSINGPYGFEQ